MTVKKQNKHIHKGCARFVGADDGFDSPRVLRSSVSRGSESPPDSHSLPLPFNSRQEKAKTPPE